MGYHHNHKKLHGKSLFILPPCSTLIISLNCHMLFVLYRADYNHAAQCRVIVEHVAYTALPLHIQTVHIHSVLVHKV